MSNVAYIMTLICQPYENEEVLGSLVELFDIYVRKIPLHRAEVYLNYMNKELFKIADSLKLKEAKDVADIKRDNPKIAGHITRDPDGSSAC